MSEVPLQRGSLGGACRHPLRPPRAQPDTKQQSQSSGSNVIPRRARPGLAGLRPQTQKATGNQIARTSGQVT